MTRTVTRLFDRFEDAKSAVAELERMGVPHSDISIVASDAQRAYANDDQTLTADEKAREAGKDASTGATVGAGLGGAGGLLAGLGMLAIPGLGPVVAAGWGDVAQRKIPANWRECSGPEPKAGKFTDDRRQIAARGSSRS